MEMKTDNKFRCWLWFANNRQEELYEVIQAMITDKVNEVLPQKVEEILRQKVDNLSFNIQTSINGQPSNFIRESITDMIIRELKK